MNNSLSAKILKSDDALAFAVGHVDGEPNVCIDIQIVFSSYFENGPLYKNMYIVVSDETIGYQAEICVVLDTWIPRADLFLNDFLSNPIAKNSLLKTILITLEKIRVFKKFDTAKSRKSFK